ncbi:MAG: hypothetical protein ACR2KC_08385 [Acidimicrobiales bacterium]
MEGVPLRAVAALVAHPRLWPVAVSVALRLAEPGWWRRWPPLPSLPPSYERFRLETFFGTDTPPRLSGSDLVEYLKWCRLMGISR